MAAHMEGKVAAIFAADIVSHSRLAGTAEVGAVARLKALRRQFVDPTIAEYRGRVVRLSHGRTLVEFASAVDAL